ncbi:hypothetical protein L2K70_12280 [Nocardioides KLBMP 9356]|uniref:Uncharacterized protein n=1 Tax=Nocardioides potassii TaxID=2911371 RepID=A0ABS9HEA5_9ACTN|nr:hypothetical protein [Nocardioides potassii]MCF6378383.1 hypothetical protein [Nocardioides potassii]
MSPETDLLTRLDHELGDLPAAPAEAYLQRGRRARRRRTVAVAAAAPVAAAAVVAAVAVLGMGGQGRESSIAEQPSVSRPATSPAIDYSDDPDFVAPEPNNPLEAQPGLEGVEWFTTDDIPSWAQEYGRHGPVSYAPDGRLWIAPDASVQRAVVNPLTYGQAGGEPSIAVEATCTCAPEDMEDDVVWVWTSPDDGGFMDAPGWTTDDFELWVDTATAAAQDRPSLAERFAHFADTVTGRMVAGAPGVTVVHREAEVDLGSGRVTHTRAGAAEVEYAGRTFYVVGVDPEEGAPWYQYWPADVEPDFASFLTMLRGNWK